MGIATTAGIFFIFVSTVLIGLFRTALIMNLVPRLAKVLSALVVGEVFTSLQVLGSAIMLASLLAFQLWK
jgi:probable blue pigment (indigoidine) exporter